MPLLVLPFRSSSHKRNSMVNSEVSVIYNSQDRPEFHRRTLTAGWRYTWSSWQKKLQHRFDFLSLNYVFMPWISEAFRRDYLDNTSSRNSVLRYSYEDLFIMRSAYNVVFNSQGSKRTGLMDYNSNFIRFVLVLRRPAIFCTLFPNCLTVVRTKTAITNCSI